MASWQFDLHCLSREVVQKKFGQLPLKMSFEKFNRESHWLAPTCLKSLKAKSTRILSPMVTSGESLSWGTDEGDRVDLLAPEGLLQECFVRIDVRSTSKAFLVNLVQVAKEWDWLFYTQDHEIVQPTFYHLLFAIRKSGAFRFVEDPQGFFEELKRNELRLKEEEYFGIV